MKRVSLDDQGGKDRRDIGIGGNARRWLAWSAVALVVLIAPGWSLGQEIALPPDFAWPRLVLNGPIGLLAPAHAMVFSPDGVYLVSGGDDKAVSVWEFRQGQPRLDRTLRPPINRVGGTIDALAISSVKDPKDGHRLLAVSGYGAIGNGGDILVYRLLGPDDPGTGDLAFVLRQDPRPIGAGAAPGSQAAGGAGPSQGDGPAQVRFGHRERVWGLAFSPDGHYLASCGADKTIRIWDVQARDHPRPAAPVEDDAPVRVLTGHSGAVLRVAFLDDDLLASSGGIGDGSVRLWAWKNADRPLVSSSIPSTELLAASAGQAVMVNAMVTSPDGRYVVTGREDGKLELFARADLGQTLLNPVDWTEHRPIEALALSPDGRWLAVSRLRDKPPLLSDGVLPRTECEITLRRMPAGDQVRVVRIAADIVRALAFSPDGRFVAAIGGQAQELTVHEVNVQGAESVPPVSELRGPGTVLWDVGFMADAPENPRVAYARIRPMPGQAALWEGFDLRGREFVPVEHPDQIRRGFDIFGGWSLRPDRGNPSRLEVVRNGANPVVIDLEGANGRWMSHTFIPPDAAAGHPHPAVAIGCREGMIVIHSLADGRKTREFLGHSGPVYGLAPSSDGRWLASVSADQTLRLWSLAGCDTRPPLGARLERDAQGNWIVNDVAVRSFAEQMGVKVGDRVAGAFKWQGTARQPLAIERLDAEIDTIPPSFGVRLVLDLIRAGAPVVPTPQTSRRDQPALSLLAASNKEWILWMPEGYYDTSIAGDSRLLGWHVNRVERRNGRIEVLPSGFYPMSRYESVLHNRDVIDRLIGTGDPVAAVRLAQNNPRIQPPPEIQVLDPQGVAIPPVFQAQQPVLALRIEARGGTPERRVASIRVRNGHVPQTPVNFQPIAPQVQVPAAEVPLWLGDNPVSIEAVDDLGVVGRREVLVQYRPRAEKPPGPQAPSRLIIRSIGIERFAAAEIGRIDFADRDADVLAEFLRERGQSNRFDPTRIERDVRNTQHNPGVSSREIREVFAELKKEALAGKIRAGDTAFLVLESYVLDRGPGSLLLGADARLQGNAEAALETNAIADDLKYVADSGCLVLLFLDGVHDRLPRQSQRNLTDWVRTLRKNGVMVLMASKQEKSERESSQRLSVFARAIRDSITVRGAGRSLPSPTLDEFQGIVIRDVETQTGRRQKADFYPPEHIRPRLIRIFEPQLRPSEELAGQEPGRSRP
jgi:WD40 repeat protein